MRLIDQNDHRLIVEVLYLNELNRMVLASRMEIGTLSIRLQVFFYTASSKEVASGYIKEAWIIVKGILKDLRSQKTFMKFYEESSEAMRVLVLSSVGEK